MHCIVWNAACRQHVALLLKAFKIDILKYDMDKKNYLLI